MRLPHTLLASALLAGAVYSATAHATLVELNTNQGNIKLHLFDETTPATVANFLNYANKGSYDDTVIHRAITGFVMQGGGFTFEEKLPLTPVATDPAVTNEPKHSNVKGTIAMAKQANNPNSATNQWFINLTDNNDPNNSLNLDQQNGGFTVFGQVVAADMAVVESIMNLTICDSSQLLNFSSPSPLINYTSIQCSDNTDIAEENLVKVMSVTVLDDDPASATNAGITPVENTLIKAEPTKPSSSSGSGSCGMWLMGALGLVALRRFK